MLHFPRSGGRQSAFCQAGGFPKPATRDSARVLNPQAVIKTSDQRSAVSGHRSAVAFVPGAKTGRVRFSLPLLRRIGAAVIGTLLMALIIQDRPSSYGWAMISHITSGLIPPDAETLAIMARRRDQRARANAWQQAYRARRAARNTKFRTASGSVPAVLRTKRPPPVRIREDRQDACPPVPARSRCPTVRLKAVAHESYFFLSHQRARSTCFFCAWCSCGEIRRPDQYVALWRGLAACRVLLKTTRFRPVCLAS